MTNISGSAPARSMARAESYSQLVPGNTGISTRGLAVPTLGGHARSAPRSYSAGSLLRRSGAPW